MIYKIKITSFLKTHFYIIIIIIFKDATIIVTINAKKPGDESLQVISPEVTESEKDLLLKRGIKIMNC